MVIFQIIYSFKYLGTTGSKMEEMAPTHDVVGAIWLVKFVPRNKCNICALRSDIVKQSIPTNCIPDILVKISSQQNHSPPVLLNTDIA